MLQPRRRRRSSTGSALEGAGSASSSRSASASGRSRRPSVDSRANNRKGKTSRRRPPGKGGCHPLVLFFVFEEQGCSLMHWYLWGLGLWFVWLVDGYIFSNHHDPAHNHLAPAERLELKPRPKPGLSAVFPLNEMEERKRFMESTSVCCLIPQWGFSVQFPISSLP